MRLSEDEVQGLINLLTHPENIREPRCHPAPIQRTNTHSHAPTQRIFDITLT